MYICDVLGGGVSFSSRSAALHHLRASACPPPLHHHRVSRCRPRETRALTSYCGRSLAFGGTAATLGTRQFLSGADHVQYALAPRRVHRSDIRNDGSDIVIVIV